MYNPNIHHRRTIRLKGYDYSQTGLYFITICVQNRQCLFGKIADGEMMLNDFGRIVEHEWLHLSTKYPNIDLHQFVVMPNHFHGILHIVGAGSARPSSNMCNNGADVNINGANVCNNVADGDINGAGRPRPYVGNMVAYFKYQTTKQINLPGKLWQRNYYEHIIRNDNSYQRIAEYITNNPAKWNGDKFYTE